MKRKIVSFITIICMVITLIPATVAASYASTVPPNISQSTVVDRITELENGLSGKFFTTDGKPAYDSGDDRCNVVNVLNRNSTVRSLIYNNKGKSGYRPDYDSYLPGHYAHDYGSVGTLGWSCFGFANFAEWYIFSQKCSDTVSTKTIAKGISYNYSNMSAKAKPGDVVRLTGNGFSGHSGIVKSVGSKYVTILDANGDAGEYYGTSRVTTRKVYYASGMKVSISRATNSVTGWPAINATNVASTGKVKLSWYKKSKASKYYVYRALASDGVYKLIKKTTSTTYTDTGATASYMYYYKVKAVSSSGKTLAWSKVATRTCDLAQPKLTGISNVASHGGIKVTFKGVKNANKYKVYRATSKDGDYKFVFDLNCNKTDSGGEAHYFINTSGTPGKTYYYKVQAVNTKNTGADSALSAYMYKTRDLAQPTVTGISNVASSGAVKIDYKGVQNADKYELYRATSKTGTYSCILYINCEPDTAGEAHYFLSTGGTRGKTYYYKVRAVMSDNSYATSALSKYVVGSVKAPATSIISSKASSMVSAATNVAGKSKSSLGLSGEWCASFIYYCAQKSGNTSEIGSSAYVGTMAEQTVNSKGGTIIFVNQNAYNSCKSRFVSSRCKYDPNYIPKKGDLYIQKGEDYGDQYFAHIGLVRKDSTNSRIAYTIEGNTSCSDGNHSDYGYVEYKTRDKNGFAAPYGFSAFVKPAY